MSDPLTACSSINRRPEVAAHIAKVQRSRLQAHVAARGLTAVDGVLELSAHYNTVPSRRVPCIGGRVASRRLRCRRCRKRIRPQRGHSSAYGAFAPGALPEKPSGTHAISDTGESRSPYDHLPGDTPEKLDYAFLEDVTRATAAAALHLGKLVQSP